jgi:hypothetical protein
MVRIVLGMGLACGLACGFSGVASAQVLTGEQAAAVLFAPTGAEVELLKTDFLPKDQAELLRQVGAAQPYYGAIAVSPDEGIMVDATVAAANQHSVEAASVAARAACDAKRKGKRPCEVVALIRPAGWEQRALQLSSGATAAFLDEYVKVTRDKALAISPTTGGWGIGKGRDAAAKAVKDCATKDPKPADCVLAVQD